MHAARTSDLTRFVSIIHLVFFSSANLTSDVSERLQTAVTSHRLHMPAPMYELNPRGGLNWREAYQLGDRRFPAVRTDLTAAICYRHSTQQSTFITTKLLPRFVALSSFLFVCCGLFQYTANSQTM